jgi:hypothetical protein
MSEEPAAKVEPYATVPVLGSRPLSLLALRAMTYDEIQEERRKGSQAIFANGTLPEY